MMEWEGAGKRENKSCAWRWKQRHSFDYDVGTLRMLEGFTLTFHYMIYTISFMLVSTSAGNHACNLSLFGIFRI